MVVLTRKEFLDDIQEIVTDAIYMAENTDELQREIANNCWSIGIDAETAKQIELADIQLFLDKVKSNRASQVQQAGKDITLLYYLWFDEQAGHLRFNLINAKHSVLPFGCNVEIVPLEASIIRKFLRSPYTDTSISSSEGLTDNQQGRDGSTSGYTLKVYSEILPSAEMK